jgi:hypothetical protein
MEANASWQGDGNAAQGGGKMIPNEVLAAWIVAATTGVAALGGLSLLDGRPSTGGMEAEPLPFHYASTTTAQRLPPLGVDWKARFEATGGLPVRPVTSLAEWGDDEVDEMDQRDMSDELFAGALATANAPIAFMGP